MSEPKRRSTYGKERPPFSEEWKANISKSAKGKNKPERTIEHRQNLSRSLKEKQIRPPVTRGKDHYMWRGGITPLTKKIRQSQHYIEWRNKIFTRDNYKCVLCGLGGNINADHYPVAFSEIFHAKNIDSVQSAIECNDFWDIDNGRTLCVPCHKKTESYAKNYKRRED